MRFEARLFLALVPFFVIVGGGYGLWSGWEPVGSAGLLLLGGLVGMIGFYLALVARRIDPRPEDNPYGEIEDGAGDQGTYSPWSWWPLVVAGGSALAFLALAVGWWLMPIGVALAGLGLSGWLLEFSRGQHAH